MSSMEDRLAVERHHGCCDESQTVSIRVVRPPRPESRDARHGLEIVVDDDLRVMATTSPNVWRE